MTSGDGTRVCQALEGLRKGLGTESWRDQDAGEKGEKKTLTGEGWQVGREGS